MGEEAGSSELIDFVLYMFVLGPSVEWCLKSPRVNKGKPGSKSGILLAVLLLTAVAGFKLSFDYVGRTPNHFETLGVRIDATSTQVKRAYRDISLIHHPDKNPEDKNAGEKFIKYQAAYEVLKDASKRDAYNKFGSADSQTEDTGSKLMSLSLFYVIWIVVGYLLTMGKASEDGRTWAFSGLLTLAVFEYQTRILSIDYLAPLFPYSTVHEKVELLHKLFPPFMHGARMISQVIFMDIGLVNKLRLEEMHLKVDELMRTVMTMGGGEAPAAGGVALPSGAAGAASADATGGGESGKPLFQAAPRPLRRSKTVCAATRRCQSALSSKKGKISRLSASPRSS